MKPEAGIVERLRIAHPNSAQRIAGSNILLEAASLIERQSRALVEAREKLRPIAEMFERYDMRDWVGDATLKVRSSHLQNVADAFATITAALTEYAGEPSPPSPAVSEKEKIEDELERVSEEEIPPLDDALLAIRARQTAEIAMRNRQLGYYTAPYAGAILLEFARRLEAKSPAVVPDGWQPIETAPIEGRVLAGRWISFGEKEWREEVVKSPPTYPFTHWQRLPAPPSEVKP